jgi:hypothetical protein
MLFSAMQALVEESVQPTVGTCEHAGPYWHTMPMQTIFPKPAMNDFIFSGEKASHVALVRPVYSGNGREVVTPGVYTQKKERRSDMCAHEVHVYRKQQNIEMKHTL